MSRSPTAQEGAAPWSLLVGLLCPKQLRAIAHGSHGTNVAPRKTKGVTRPINGRRHAWILAAPWAAVIVTGPRIYARVKKERERKRKRMPKVPASRRGPGTILLDPSCPGQSRIKHLLAARIARVPRLSRPGTLPARVLRASRVGLFLPPATEIVSRLTEHQPERVLSTSSHDGHVEMDAARNSAPFSRDLPPEEREGRGAFFGILEARL